MQRSVAPPAVGVGEVVRFGPCIGLFLRAGYVSTAEAAFVSYQVQVQISWKVLSSMTATALESLKVILLRDEQISRCAHPSHRKEKNPKQQEKQRPRS